MELLEVILKMKNRLKCFTLKGISGICRKFYYGDLKFWTNVWRTLFWYFNYKKYTQRFCQFTDGLFGNIETLGNISRSSRIINTSVKPQINNFLYLVSIAASCWPPFVKCTGSVGNGARIWLFLLFGESFLLKILDMEKLVYPEFVEDMVVLLILLLLVSGGVLGGLSLVDSVVIWPLVRWLYWLLNKCALCKLWKELGDKVDALVVSKLAANDEGEVGRDDDFKCPLCTLW